jgi:hypothetical protein
LNGKVLVAFIRPAIVVSLVCALELQEERKTLWKIISSGLLNDDFNKSVYVTLHDGRLVRKVRETYASNLSYF